MIKEFILQNWALTLILVAFAVLVKTNIYLDVKTRNRMYGLIAAVFILSVIVFAEFYLGELGTMVRQRVVLMAVRYSATPLIIAMTLYTLARTDRLLIFIPALICALINIASIFNGAVFALTDDGTLVRGALGYLPYIAVGLYCFLIVFILAKEGNKQAGEIIPMLYLCFTFASGLILPFFLGKDYFRIFCTNIAIALFVYYDFSILHLTKKDPLTGLLNRQAYEHEIGESKNDINAIMSLDMNGLKRINDQEGHAAGDEALKCLAQCFLRAAKKRQLAYRIGGDEFLIVCKNASEGDVQQLAERIGKNVAKTKYHCAVGYSFSPDGTKTISEMLKEADDMMYAEKEEYYSTSGEKKYR